MKFTTELNSGDEDHMNLYAQVNDEDWTTFCDNELKVFETKWTKKLEDYGDKAEEEEPFRFRTTPKQVADNESRRYQDSNEDSESVISNMLLTGSFKKDLMIKKNKLIKIKAKKG